MADLSPNLKVFLARELQRQFSSLDNSVSLFIGGTDSTATSTVLSPNNEINTRRQIQTAKILTDSRVALMIPRVNWTNKTIYQNYSLAHDNSTRNFYVYTTDGNVYACISNGGGRQSIEEPTGTGTGLIYLSNGYVWKFLYKVPTELIDFVDSDYIPVRELPVYEDKPFAYASEDKQLQYAVQFTSTGGIIDSINVVTQGSEYPRIIKAASNHRFRETTTTTLKLDQRASSTDDFYNDYTIRITSGQAAGQFRKITDYDGSTKTATVETAFDPAPDTSSIYEIIPSITISGDGRNATAYAKITGYAAKSIQSIVVANAGQNYTTATVTVSPATTPTATVLSANVDPRDALGRSALFDLFATRLSIIVKIEGRERQRAVLGNDYRQYGLWVSPKIGAGYADAGEVAGTNSYIRTKVDLEPLSGKTFDNNWAQAGDYLFGSESYNSGKIADVTNGFSRLSLTKAQVTIDGLDRPFKNGEQVYTFKDVAGGGYTFTNNVAKVKNTLFEDSTRSSFTETYRCSHKVGVSRTDGLSFDPGVPFSNIPFDQGVTGGSGSVGLVLDFTNIKGGSGDLFLTKVISGSSADTTSGFIAGETLAAGSLELDITSVSPPELNLFSGRILYINDIEQVTRNAEQLDLFKINFDF